MSSVILDVAIGLVFIYLMYALFISLITEIIATWLGMRSRMLRQGIGNLLNDHKKRTDEWSHLFGAIGDFFLYKKEEFNYTKAGMFYEHPAVKFLSVEKKRWYLITKKAKPAYIRRSTFSSALLDMLREKGEGICDWDTIKFSIEKNAAHFDAETSKQLQTLLNDSEDDMDLFIERVEAWYDEMMERVNGWYKRRVRFMLFWIGFIVVLFFNVDTFQIIRILGNDNDARKGIVEMAMNLEEIKAVDTIGSKDAKSLDTLQQELQVLKKGIDRANTMLGLGWDFDKYKKPVQSFKIKIKKDSLEKFSKNLLSTILTRSPKLNERITILKDSINNLYDSIRKDPGLFQDSIRILKKRMDENKGKDQSQKKHLLAIQFMEDSINNYASKLHTVRKPIWKKKIQLSRDSLVAFATSVNNNSNTNRLLEVTGILPHATKKRTYCINGIASPSLWGKAKIMSPGLNPFKMHFWGLWITALALSLGAPFWFDIMKKLISIKNVGVNGDEKQKGKDQSSLSNAGKSKGGRGKTINTSDPVAIFLSHNRSFWESIPGVCAINQLKDLSSNVIELVIDEGLKKKESEIRTLAHSVVDQTISKDQIQLRFSKPASIAGFVKHNTTKAEGTCAGVLFNKKTNKRCILSCAHVFQSDQSSFFSEDKNVILGPDGETEIARVTNQIKSNFLDAAVADLKTQNDKTYINIPKPYVVGVQDWGTTEVLVCKKNGEKTVGTIVHSRIEYHFEGPKGNYKMYHLIAISGKKVDQQGKVEEIPISKPGDSGALVCLKKEDNAGNPIPGDSIGIIVGGVIDSESKFSLVNPMPDILEALDLQILPSN